MPAKLRGTESGRGRPGRRLQFQPSLKCVVETPVKLQLLKMNVDGYNQENTLRQGEGKLQDS